MSSGASPIASVPTLAGLLWPAAGPAGRALRAAGLMLAGSLLLALSAKVQVPFPPVPMTLQTLIVLVIGAAYGWRLGAATVALYLAEGLMGFPVFAGPVAGPLYMAGPTGGFLVGFVAAAALTGFLAERGWDRPLLRVVGLMALGHAVIFAFGLTWLSVLLGPAKAWAVGAAPFVLATVLKTALAAALMQAAWSLARR
ncbi:MAG TPA: biotin transporter BioY [Beijerinckiaceae bacterium]|jgi:biotin transport system substrate-specific component